MDEIIANYKSVFAKWSDFKGRSRRREYWLFALVNIVAAIVLGMIDRTIFHAGFYGGEYHAGPLGGLYTLATLVPGMAVSFRRLHDAGKSAWWILAGLIPIVNFIGIFVLLYFTIKDSEPDNIYGPNPKGLISAA